MSKRESRESKRESRECSILQMRAHAIKGNLNALKKCMDLGTLSKKNMQIILNNAALGCSYDVVEYLFNYRSYIEPTMETLYYCFKNIGNSPKKTINGIKIIDLLINRAYIDPNHIYKGNNAFMMLEFCNIYHKPLIKEIFDILAKGTKPRIIKSKEYMDHIYYINGIFDLYKVDDSNIEGILDDIIKKKEKHEYIMDLIYKNEEVPAKYSKVKLNKRIIQRVLHNKN